MWFDVEMQRGETSIIRQKWVNEKVACRWGWDRVPSRGELGEQDAGDHEGPPRRPASTLAPTGTKHMGAGHGRRTTQGVPRPYGDEAYGSRTRATQASPPRTTRPPPLRV